MLESLSVILPFYNEEKRLKTTLTKIIEFTKKNEIKFKEFIFVDDGSDDRSNEIIENFNLNIKSTNIKIKLIKLPKNLGKGGALKEGIKVATHKWILTSDIDFSVSLFEIDNWSNLNLIDDQNKVYFASRAHLKSKVNSKIYRKIAGECLSLLISFLLGIKVKDTQCGFKLYKNTIAKEIFSKLIFLGYEHDLEIVLLLRDRKIIIDELPVTWNHVSDSKVNILLDSFKVLYKILLMKLRYK